MASYSRSQYDPATAVLLLCFTVIMFVVPSERKDEESYWLQKGEVVDRIRRSLRAGVWLR